MTLKMKKIEIEIPEESFNLLQALDKDPTKAIENLANHAADGIRRPGAWERNWVIQCFGDDFEDKLEVNPEQRYYERLKK